MAKTLDLLDAFLDSIDDGVDDISLENKGAFHGAGWSGGGSGLKHVNDLSVGERPSSSLYHSTVKIKYSVDDLTKMNKILTKLKAELVFKATLAKSDWNNEIGQFLKHTKEPEGVELRGDVFYKYHHKKMYSIFDSIIINLKQLAQLMKRRKQDKQAAALDKLCLFFKKEERKIDNLYRQQGDAMASTR